MGGEYLKTKPKQIIIIGGGASIKEGIDKGLWDKIDHKWTIGTNYSFNYFNSTMLCYVDIDFYRKQTEKLKGIPLIVGKYYHQGLTVHPNTIMLPTGNEYDRTLKKGVYKSALVGLFALSVAINLLDEGEIYLLGFDYGELRKKDFEKHAKSRQELFDLSYRDKEGLLVTHFYQGEVKHRGIGKTSYYNHKNRADKDFGVYKNEKNVKIYNVSTRSKITVFPKITYEEFFNKLDKNKYCQSYLEAYTKVKLAYIKEKI